MALFFFNLVSPKGYEVDEIGSEFPDVEAAFLEGHEAALEMCVDIMRAREDAMLYQFEIVDDQGRFLMEVPFSDVIRPRRAAFTASHSQIRQKLRAEIRRACKLCSELDEEIKKSRVIVASSLAARARSIAS